MGLLGSVARVGCWRRRASVVLEEWSPIRFGGGQNPAYRPSGVFVWASGAGVRVRALGSPPALRAVRARVRACGPCPLDFPFLASSQRKLGSLAGYPPLIRERCQPALA